jgi:hypothetical protein
MLAASRASICRVKSCEALLEPRIGQVRDANELAAMLARLRSGHR